MILGKSMLDGFLRYLSRLCEGDEVFFVPWQEHAGWFPKVFFCDEGFLLFLQEHAGWFPKVSPDHEDFWLC